MEVRAFLRAHWDRALSAAFVVVGVVMLVVGWLDVSGTGIVAEQNPYIISAGLGGVAFIVVGSALWISADIQDEWRRLDAIEEKLARLAGESRPADSPGGPEISSDVASNGAARRTKAKVGPTAIPAELSEQR